MNKYMLINSLMITILLFTLLMLTIKVIDVINNPFLFDTIDGKVVQVYSPMILDGKLDWYDILPETFRRMNGFQVLSCFISILYLAYKGLDITNKSRAVSNNGY